MGKTIVIGGGVIGLLAAYELRRRGHDVTVLERGEPGKGASKGNAGWVTPSLSGPVPAPGIVATSLKWMLNPDSPLYIRPSAVPQLAGWLLTFWKHCNPRAYHAGLTATAQLNRRTMEHFDALVQAGLQFEMYQTGLLFVCLEEATIDRLMRDFTELESFGLGTPRRYSAEEIRQLEPVFNSNVVGGVWMEKERHVRPESLLAAVLKWLQANGVEVYSQTPVSGFDSEGRRVTGVKTAKGTWPADQVLIATGAEAAFLARQAGFNLPMQAGKGYSITIHEPQLRIGRPMYLEEARVALSPYKGTLRVAGTMELSGINAHLDQRRVEAIRRGASRYLLDGWEKGSRTEVWAGMRPMLPDGLPAIGRAPGYENLFVAAGHAMLGITLGPSTAVAIADVMTKGESDYDLMPFDPGRFHRK